MNTPDAEQVAQVVRQLWRSRNNLQRSLAVFHLVGYALLLLGLIDLAEILIPPLLMNPQWEFQAFGQIVERVPVLMIGLGFVFLGGSEERPVWELLLLRILSWLTLVAGILYLLLLPLGIVNTVRIDRLNQRQIAAQTEELQAQIEQAKADIAGVQNQEELQALILRFAGQNAPSLGENASIADVKAELTGAIEENEATVTAEAESTLAARRRDLFERSVKWNVGTLITGIAYVLIWRSTIWARRKV